MGKQHTRELTNTLSLDDAAKKAARTPVVNIGCAVSVARGMAMLRELIFLFPLLSVDHSLDAFIYTCALELIAR